MNRLPWHQLPETTGWDALEEECVRLNVPEQAQSIISACRLGGFTPREGIGILRAIRNRNYCVDLPELFERFADRGQPVGEVLRRLRNHKSYVPERCPVALRRQVIDAFGYICEYCGRRGVSGADPDGKPWHVDRLIPLEAGRYEPTNVTLACARCNLRKCAKPAPPGTRSLADVLATRIPHG